MHENWFRSDDLWAFPGNIHNPGQVEVFTGKNNWGQISICMAHNLLSQYNVCLISATRQKFKNTGDLSKVFVVCKNLQ